MRRILPMGLFQKIEENLKSIVERLKNKSYKPSPARRVNIPKANGKMRRLAIAQTLRTK